MIFAGLLIRNRDDEDISDQIQNQKRSKFRQETVNEFMKGRVNSFLVLADQAFVSGVNFLTGLLLARFLGMDGYGRFVLAYGIVLFIAGIQMAVIIAPMMVNGPALPDDQSKAYYRAVILQQSIFSIILVLVFPLAGIITNRMWPSWGFNTLILPLTAVAFCFLCQDFLRRFFFACNQPGSALTNDAISYGLQLILILLLKENNNLNAATALWAIAATSLAAILFGFFHHKHHRFLGWPGQLSWTHANRVNWNVGKWLIGTNIVYWGGSQLVIYMAAGILSVEAVGAMTATRNVVGVGNVLFLAMENFVPSRASRIFASRGSGDLNRYLIRVALAGGCGTLLIVVVAGLWPETWLHLFYGSAYKGYGWLILWWGLFNLIGFFHRPLIAGLRVLNRARAIFNANLAGSIFALLFSAFALRYGGLQGGMVSLCLIQAVILLVLAVSYMRTTPIKNSGLTVAEHAFDPVRRKDE